MTPQSLVCAKCWRDFFDTEAFEQGCTSNDNTGRCRNTGVVATSTIKEVKEAKCNWCAFLRDLFRRSSWSLGDKLTVSFSPSSISSCIPRGRNVFYLSISCNAPGGEWIGGYALFLRAWTTADDRASGYLPARPLRGDVHSDEAKAQVKTWLQDCTSHTHCSALHQDSPLPTRVIEIDLLGRATPRIVETEGVRGRYATLSYCWGTTSFSTLTSSNYDQLTNELDLDALPLTFIHAISTARNLSIPYLWIDALCIMQDSTEDKLREMSRMKDIYSSSSLTIVAASAKDVFEGFLHPRPVLQKSYTIPYRLRPGSFGTMSIDKLDTAAYDERIEPVAKRAWTMQEQLLAQRTLTFTSRTMMWRCPTETKNFGDSLYFPHDLDSGYNDNDDKYSLNLQSLLLNADEASAHRDKALSCWLRLVTAYSLRTTSLEHDKLNAVAGIASHSSFSYSLGPHYFAGMWQYRFQHQLTWRTSNRHRTLPDAHNIVHRPSIYRGPSWSWASIEGGVIHFDFSYDDEDEVVPIAVCDIIECTVVPKFPDLNPYGEVCSGTLRILSAARSAWFNPTTCNIYLLSELTPEDSWRDYWHGGKAVTIAEASQRHTSDFLSLHPDVDLEEDPEAIHGTDYRNICGEHDETGDHQPFLVICVAITCDHEKEDGVTGLLLLPTGADSKTYAFTRIGYFERGRNRDFLHKTKMEISIV